LDKTPKAQEGKAYFYVSAKIFKQKKWINKIIFMQFGGRGKCDR
jgi:hypothetical protein